MTRKIPKELTEMSEQWKQLKETIIEIRDNNEFEREDVTLLCQFLANYMDVLERDASYTPQPKMGRWIDKDDKSAVCPFCNRNNTLYGDYCKWCGKKVGLEHNTNWQ